MDDRGMSLYRRMNVQGAPIKNNPLEKMLYFSHGFTDLSQTFRFVCEYLHNVFCEFY